MSAAKAVSPPARPVAHHSLRVASHQAPTIGATPYCSVFEL